MHKLLLTLTKKLGYELGLSRSISYTKINLSENGQSRRSADDETFFEEYKLKPYLGDEAFEKAEKVMSDTLSNYRMQYNTSTKELFSIRAERDKAKKVKSDWLVTK